MLTTKEKLSLAQFFSLMRLRLPTADPTFTILGPAFEFLSRGRKE
jgi:hypothetical protein